MPANCTLPQTEGASSDACPGATLGRSGTVYVLGCFIF